MIRTSLPIGILAAIILLGCGGSGAGTGQFAGGYYGTITYSDNTQEELELNIYSGMINGVNYDNGGQATWSFLGNVQSSGQFTMTASVEGNPNRVYTGTLSLASGNLKGSGNMTQNSVTVSFSFNLPPVRVTSVSGDSATGG